MTRAGWLGAVALLMAAGPALAQQKVTIPAVPIAPAAQTAHIGPDATPLPENPDPPLTGPGRQDDVPASGSSSNYVHSPSEGAVPGGPAFKLGGPPPGTQPDSGGP